MNIKYLNVDSGHKKMKFRQSIDFIQKIEKKESKN